MGDALEGDLPLRLERHLLRNSRLPPATAIVDPGLRNVKTIGGGNAHRFVGQRHRDGDLAVVLLTEHAAVLARHSDRVPPFLRNSCVVHYPGRHCAMTLHLLQHVVTRYPQDRLVIPRSIGNEVMQRLMAGPNVPRVDTGGHRLDALSLSGQTEAHQIRTQRLAAVRVPEHGGHALQVVLESAFGAADSLHHEQYRRCCDGLLRSFYDTVVLAPYDYPSGLGPSPERWCRSRGRPTPGTSSSRSTRTLVVPRPSSRARWSGPPSPEPSGEPVQPVLHEGPVSCVLALLPLVRVLPLGPAR